MSPDNNRKHRPSHGEEHAETAADEVFHEVEDAEIRLVDGGERPRKDGEAADALTPNEDAQEDVHERDS
ncbi:hypothetical protein ACFQ0X_42430 [Streptomyces rectiviolaceus]|uniref:Multidrug transporter n=1 Tax=Streptomyces rectiviolaceus TaxID=332591 RepID=A0ABP6MJ40_9ACTN